MSDLKQELFLMNELRTWNQSQLTGLSVEQLTAIPQGFNNNILWNVGHLLHYQIEFTYSLSGAKSPLPESIAEKMGAWFGNSTSPKNWTEQPDSTLIIEHFKSIGDRLVADHAKGVFAGFKPIKPFGNLQWDTLQHALIFHLAHEGMHMASIGALKKFVK